MVAVNNGPSDDAWGANLSDPVLVKHQSRLILFARAQLDPVGTLYFRVLDPSAASAGDDLSAWNGWYRYQFPEVAAAALPQNAEEAAAIPARELRLAGMDLLTVTPVAEPVAAADASFRVSSDGAFLNIYRQSAAGTLLLNRVGLLSRSEDVDGNSVERFALEPAWEIRFRRSGLRDVPLDEMDGEAYLDPTGEPFYEPAIEFARISALASGAFDVAQVPTVDSEISVIYAAVATFNGVQMHQVRRTATSLTDYTETPVVYPPITPTLRSGGAALTPIAGLAPSLTFYAEQEMASTVEGDEAELQRAGHLMLAIPVTGGGLDAAVAVYDFALDRQGNIPVLPTSGQSLVLVDGTLTGGVWVPDTKAPAYPTPADLPATVQIVGGLLVSSMVLGQVQPTQSPVLYFGDDGLVHLYFGGPLPVPPFDRWSSLDPKLPQAMVAQFDARANRLLLSAPWVMTEVEEQQNGAVEFYALQSGCIMDGANIVVADGALGPNGAAAPDLCDVTINYPAASGLPNETWRAVPRSLGPFMDVLNGEGSNDAADPAVLSGTKPFFDYSGTLAIARLPLTLPSGVSAGPPPVVTFVSTMPDLSLASVTVAANGVDQDYTLTFQGPAGAVLTSHWRSVPAVVATFADLFNGVAAASTYGYPADTDGTPLFGLATNAIGIPAPVVLYSLGTNAEAPGLTIEAKASASVPGALDVTFKTSSGGVPITGVPAEVADSEDKGHKILGFVSTLQGNAAFQGLGLGITGSTAAGRVQATPIPVGRMGLAATAALFDVLMPAIDLTGASVALEQYVAGVQGHSFDPTSALDRNRMAGFLATSLRPSAGATAYVQNCPGGATRSLSRSLYPQGGVDPLVSGVWVRPPVQQQCAFDGTDNLTVPVVDQGAAILSSVNLRPQWDWTLEAWVRPSAGEHQRLLTFLDNVTAVPSGAPALAYAVALESQKVVTGSSYAKQPGSPDSSYFQTGTSPSGKASFMPSGEFTWELWVKPNDQAGPPINRWTTPLGGVIQLGQAKNTPFLVVGLTADRHVEIVALDDISNTHVYTSTAIVPALDTNGAPTWSHLALIGEQDPSTKLWTLQLLLDAGAAGTFTNVALDVQPGAFLVIGANTPDNATLYGSMAQLRYWSIARTAADIRRTWLTSMSGSEPGLLGNWPLSAIETGGINGKFVRNTAAATSTDWDAPFFPSVQPVGTADDSFFLSLVASVGGLPTVKVDALLANERWNHLALVYQAGGALAMNTDDARYESGRYDWLNCGPAGDLGPTGKFAIDTFLRIPAGTQGQRGSIGTIMARWANDDDPDNKGFHYWIDEAGEMHLSVAVITDDTGTVEIKSAQSSGAALADGLTHHVAVVFDWKRGSGKDPSATWTITFYKEGVAVGATPETIDGITTVNLRTTEGDLTIGCAFGPIAGAAAMPAEDFSYFRGTLGKLRFWGTAARIEALFPERHPRIPQAGTPGGLMAGWAFREQAGRIAFDLVGGTDGTLSNSSMWSSLADTSTLFFVANGALVGHVTPAKAPLKPVSQAQFTMGTPLGGAGVAGFTGDIAQVALYDEARSIEMIQDQMYVPCYGSESSLIACWNFSDGGADITGGKNNIAPPVPAARLSASFAPMSNEGPYVRNTYGGGITDLSQSAPGQIAVGSYADARNVGTPRQRGVLKRQYIVDPGQTLARAIQIGELDLTYVGQVQTDPTLIGYIEGPPPVPSENLTRPSYLSPGDPPYIDTATVSLVQEAGETMVFTSSSSHATQIEAGTAIGLLGKGKAAISVGGPLFSIITGYFDTRVVAQVVGKASGEIGAGEGEGVTASWIATQRDTMGVRGDWEPFQKDQNKYLNPVVGRRFLVDNAGYALVESLTADLYALTFGPTKASLGTIVLPNPSIPLDRNIIVFPMNNRYTKNGTLDGKVGLVNDPDYPEADVRRGSYFKPVEAYALAASIERQRQRSESISKQFDPARKAHGWDTSLDDARKALSQDFSETPGDPVAVATPVQGLVNRYVWTSNGGFHAEEQRTGASSMRSYAGNVARGGGGGFHGEGEFYIGVGVAWSFDVMATHRVDVQVSKENKTEQLLQLQVNVIGEPYLRAYDPEIPAEYGDGMGAFRPGQAPGKVPTYRFMTFYLPPSASNSANFQNIVDPAWFRLSNDANARALRQLDSSSPVWRLLHRVTYVERIPPPIASRPIFTPAPGIVAPANIEGNAELIRLIDQQIPSTTKERTRLIVGNAVAAALNPSPTAPGVYPPAALEKLVPWWLDFLNRARPTANGGPPDPKAAALLQALMSRTTAYLFDGYASKSFAGILPKS